jgi:hypothetical protein
MRQSIGRLILKGLKFFWVLFTIVGIPLALISGNALYWMMTWLILVCGLLIAILRWN